jgi:serine/threonine-protein kinase
MIGLQLENYRVLEKIGDGGMGDVYRAFDVMLERDVALKFLRSELARDPDLVRRFRSEGQVLARLMHPGRPSLTWCGGPAGSRRWNR